MCFGFGNYMVAYGMKTWRNDYTVLFPEGFSFILFWLIYHVIGLSERFKKGKSLWAKQDSVYFSKFNQSLNAKPIIITILRGIAAVLIPINISLMTYICNQIGVSPAVIQSFTSMTTFMTALLFWFLYQESLIRQHLLGMLLIVTSVVIVAFGKSAFSGDPRETTKNPWAILAPIGIVFLNCLLLTFSSQAARSSRSCGYLPMHFVADFSLVAGVVYVAFLWMAAEAYPASLILFMMGAGIMINLAFMFLNAAVVSGKGALAMAITQTQSIFWLSLEIGISMRMPRGYEVAGMLVGVAGAAIIALAKK
jgi:drug/metabolite transporter (DMT)-like permease